MAVQNSDKTKGSKSFPSEFATPEEKASDEYGLQFGKAIWWEADGGEKREFTTRQNEIISARRWSEGMHDVSQFIDTYYGAEDLNFVTLNTNVDTPIAKLINSFANDLTSRGYDVVISTIDKMSKGEKDKELNRRISAVKIKQKLDELEAQGQDVTAARELFADKIDFSNTPDTIDDVYYDMELNYKSPLEEAIEGAIDWVFSRNKIHKIEHKMAKDLAVIQKAAYDIYLDNNNDIKIDYADPKNIVTSYCTNYDYSDARWVGVVKEMPLSQLMALSKNKFTDEEYFQMARKAHGLRSGNGKWTYGSYLGASLSDINELSDQIVLVLRFQFKTEEKRRVKVKRSKSGQLNVKDVELDYTLKDNEAGDLLDESDIVIYGGYHVVNSEFVFGYGKEKNIIKPYDGDGVSPECMFNIGIISPDMLDMATKSLLEKMRPHAEQLIVTELKIQHILSSLKPSGLAIDMSTIQNISDGLGKRFLTYKDLQEIYQQTGNQYFKSMRADGTPRVAPTVAPITELPNNGDLHKLEGLMATYNHYLEKIYQVTGFNDAMAGGIPEKGTLVGIQELNIKGYNNAVKHLYDAFADLISELAGKCAIMIQDKIIRNEDVKAYRKGIGDRYVDLIDLAGHNTMTELGMSIRYRPTFQEQQDVIEAIKLGVQAGFVTPAVMLRAKELSETSPKQAQRYLKKEEERFFQREQEKQMQLAEQNRVAQLEAPKAASEARVAELQAEYMLKNDFEEEQHRRKMEQIRLKDGILKSQQQLLQGDIDNELIEASQGDENFTPEENKVSSKVRKRGENAGKTTNSKGTPMATPSPRVNKIPQDNAQQRAAI